MKFIAVLFICFCFFRVITAQKCKIPSTAPERIEKVINQCQDEIKLAILTEALQTLKTDVPSLNRRLKREIFNKEEKRIAGCLLQCVYRKMKAVDEFGFPTVEGLLRIYTDGVVDQGYYLATLQAVQQCLVVAQKRHIQKLTIDNGLTCDVAYDTFECVSDIVGEYCGQKP